jgi:phosphoglycerol transferase
VTRRGDALFAAAAALLPLVGALLALRSWRGDLEIPLQYYGDVNLQHLLVKTVLDRGWFYENDLLGAPNGLELYDYPVLSGDTLNVVVIALLGLFGLGSGAAMNVLFLLTFPAVGLVAYLMLRRLGAERGPALVCAVLYALLPYHFIRSEGHLFLAAYYAVPAGAYLALAVLGGDELVGRWRRTLVTVALAAFVTVASGSFYYAAFTALLVLVAALLRFVATRERRTLLAGGLVVATVFAVSVLQLVPTLVYRAANGKNDQVAKRLTFESELYALKLTQLVLPLDQHRISAVARVKQRYSERFPPNDANAATLGVVGTAGLAWLFGVVLVAIAGRRPRGRHPALAALTLVAFLAATVGGAGTLIGWLWPQVRAWNRLSVFIAFFALAAVALGLGALRRRLSAPAFAALLLAVFAVGVLDQTTDAYVPDYGVVGAEWRHDRTFIRSLEDRLPEDARVAQLPYEPFPEPAAARQAVYEPVKAYLHSDDLRWSYGAMRGRPEDWAATIAEKPAVEVAAAARSEGFAGVLVDRLGYPDNGAAIEADLREALPAQPLSSPNGRFLFFAL